MNYIVYYKGERLEIPLEDAKDVLTAKLLAAYYFKINKKDVMRFDCDPQYQALIVEPGYA